MESLPGGRPALPTQLRGCITIRNPYSRTFVRVPERDLAEVILDLAKPLLEKLGSMPTMEDTHEAIALAVTFWNANVLASKRWEPPRVKELTDLKKRMRGRQASREDAATFNLLTELWHKHWLDPRLVESWTYQPDASGEPRLVCTMALPDGVEAEVPPPAEKRIAVGGRFLDEVRISQGGNAVLMSPVERHSGTISEDGTATVRTMMPSALQLFAEGKLSPVNGGHVQVAIGGRTLGPMVLTDVRCGGEHLRHDVVLRQVAIRAACFPTVATIGKR